MEPASRVPQSPPAWTGPPEKRSSRWSYKILFLVFVFLGSIVSATNVMNFGDTMILACAVPNIIGLYVLGPKVKKALDEYMRKLNAGEFATYK